jgi:hypothetical protein
VVRYPYYNKYPIVKSKLGMKNLYIFLISLSFSSFCAAQLTVNGFANNPTVCSGSSTLITATASPVGYSVSTIPTSLLGSFYSNVLADALSANFTPRSAGIDYNDCRWDGISIPFSFSYFGSPVSAVNISSNGWLTFSATSSTTGFGFALPNGGQPNNAVHGITTNLTLAAAGVLEHYVDGVAPNRRFVVRYEDVPFTTGGAATFEIHLLETSNIIEIHTEYCTNTTAAKAQGVENAAGTIATTPAGRNNTTNWTATGYTNSYRFTPDVINYTWSPAATLSSSTGSSVTATPTITTIYTINAVNATNAATGNTTVTVTVNAGSFTLAGTAGGASVCQNISVGAGATNYRDAANCNLIAQVTPAGGSPVTNTINTCIKVDVAPTKRGTSDLYLARKYDIEPLVSPATATANIKLFYLQSEFDAFNTKATDSGHKLLPVGPADATGISNVVMRQFHGTGTNPTNYTGIHIDFTTATPGFTVVWNSTQNWWEITVPVDGFSGFYITSAKSSPLAITLNYFTGNQSGNKHLLNWKVNCTSDEAKFELQRSTDGLNFYPINAFTASKLRCADAFAFTDENPAVGKNYYRLKLIDVDGKVNYSNTVLLTQKAAHFNLVSLNPNVVTSQNAMLKINTSVKEVVTVVLSDFSGRFIQNQPVTLQAGSNQIPIQAIGLAAGIYHVTIYSGNDKPISLKLIKQ